MSLSPERTEKAIRLLHSGSVNTLDALRSLTSLIDLQQQQIRILTDKVEALENLRKADEQKAYQKILDDADIADGQWYREANGLG